MKLINEIAKNMFAMSQEDIKDAFNNRLDQLGFEGVRAKEVDTDFGGDTIVTFIDEEGDELDILFTLDPEEGAIAVILDDEDDFENGPMEDGEIDLVDLDSLDPNIVDLGDGFQAIDLVNLDWLNASGFSAILNSGDFLDDDDEEEENIGGDPQEVAEVSKVVIRGGKKVRLALVRRKRRKRLTPKQRAGIKRGARKRKAKSGQISRKRKKSLKLRKRSNLKRNTNKRLRVQGS